MTTGAEAEFVSWGTLAAVSGIMTGAGAAVAMFAAWLWRQLSAHQRDLADFKVKVAERYVTTDAMIQVERRLVSAINRLTDRFEFGLSAMGFHLPKRRSDGEPESES
jgi:regulator of sigma D